MQAESSSSGLYSPSSAGSSVFSGFLHKVEIRAMGLISRRRYWFALSPDSSNYLYWFKDPNDITCVGRLSLKGAAFTYNPVEKGRFEIHAGADVYTLEASSLQERDEWLEALQNTRKYCQSEPQYNSDIISLSSHNGDDEKEEEETGEASGEREKDEENDSVTSSSRDLFNALLGPRGSADSQETLTEKEETDSDSQNGTTAFCIPMSSDVMEPLSLNNPSSTFYLNTDGELNEKSMEMPEEPTGLLRKLSERTADSRPMKALVKTKKNLLHLKDCDECKKRETHTEALEERCHDLEDHVSSLENMVKVLKQGLLTAQKQVESMKAMGGFQCDDDMRDFLLEKESQLTKLQLDNNGLNRKIQQIEAENREMETRVAELSSSVEAFRDSVRTKEELIMRLFEENAMVEEKVVDEMACGDAEATEAILVDTHSGLKCDEEAQQVFEAVGVRDINELKDLVEGYKAQNKFLSNEVVALHGEVENLLKVERNLHRKNFDIEACYYQLKSRYLMVLNHFKSPEKPGKIMEPGVLRQLIEEANRPPREPQQKETDTLGFYLQGKSEADEDSEDLLDVAAKHMAKANGITEARRLEQSEDYMNWLQSWDALLVNFVGRQLIHSQDLKNLVRTGVPPAYRSRVWKGLVNIWVKEKMAEYGHGYYASMLRKARTKTEDGTYDSAIKQIDLDLARTLPTNKHFDDPESTKIDLLRNVLYAFRYHNKEVGYCQGLNRLAAISLLYLDEEDAFWFMVACVEYLQPEGYYTATLIGAVADQKVLRDLVAEKLPKLAAHLRGMEVDLSLFTLSWFLTCFVDILPHSVYLCIFDVFLYEGNKALFRFALALLKLGEPSVLKCKTIGTVHACLSRVAECVTDFKALAQIAFNDMNPFPQRMIETKRALYLNELKNQGYS